MSTITAPSMRGYRRPEDVTILMDATYNEATDMHAELYGRKADSGYYVGTYSGAVGLVLWWDVENYASGMAMIQRYANVEVEG